MAKAEESLTSAGQDYEGRATVGVGRPVILSSTAPARSDTIASRRNLGRGRHSGEELDDAFSVRSKADYTSDLVLNAGVFALVIPEAMDGEEAE